MKETTPAPQIIHQTQLPAFILEVEKLVKEITPTEVAALKAIHLMLEVMNSQQLYITRLKDELQKLDRLNKSQAEMIHARGIIV